MLYATKNKTDFLGMPFNMASGRLKKDIMLSLIRRVGEDRCFKCNKKIKSSKELSIEHKKPWLYVSKSLFWDMSNIAFSHILCNRPHRRGRPNVKIGMPGESWCTDCKGFLPNSEFTPSRTRWNGFENKCKNHKKIRRDLWRSKRRSAGLPVT